MERLKYAMLQRISLLQMNRAISAPVLRRSLQNPLRFMHSSRPLLRMKGPVHRRIEKYEGRTKKGFNPHNFGWYTARVVVATELGAAMFLFGGCFYVFYWATDEFRDLPSFSMIGGEVWTQMKAVPEHLVNSLKAPSILPEGAEDPVLTKDESKKNEDES